MSDLLTVRDVAHIMQISEDTAARIFAKMDGVIDLGRSETRNRRRYRVLRIPKAVLESYLSRKAGKTVTSTCRCSQPSTAVQITGNGGRSWPLPRRGFKTIATTKRCTARLATAPTYSQKFRKPIVLKLRKPPGPTRKRIWS